MTTSFKAAIVELTRQINSLLFQLGGTGTDISEKSYNIYYLLDEYETRQLRYIASIEHTVVNEKNVRIKGEHQRCIHTCEWMVKRLELHLHAQAEIRKNGMSSPSRSRGRHFLESIRPEMSQTAIVYCAAGAGLLCLLILPFLCTKTVEIGEWPYDRIESLTIWPEVIFWMLAVGATTFYGMRRISTQTVKPL